MTASRKFTIAFAVVTMGGLAGLIVWGEMNAPPSPPQSATPPATQTQTVQTRTPEPVVEARTPEQQVVDQMIDRYRIVVESGTYTDICAQAGFVKAAYLQAGDKVGYAKWVKVESAACAYSNGSLTIDQYAARLGKDTREECRTRVSEQRQEDASMMQQLYKSCPDNDTQCREAAKQTVEGSHNPEERCDDEGPTKTVAQWRAYLVDAALTGKMP
jgi:hypothetical protein